MINDLQYQLKKSGYLASSQMIASVQACLNNKPVAGAFLIGAPGTGKTFLAETLAKIENAEAFFYQCFPGTREEDLLFKLLPDENTSSGIRMTEGVIPQAVNNTAKGITYLILDEWDKTRPSADSFLLDFLQSGRINYNGNKLVANMQALRVFITLNDERELSEPLLRRLPVIEFYPLSSADVRSALEITHSGHPQLEASVVLYEKCLKAGLSKPATIQELRQLLDAISLLGEQADWNALVFQFVTKTRENHSLLARGGNDNGDDYDDDYCEIDVSDYETNTSDNLTSIPTELPSIPKLPKMREIKNFGSLPSSTSVSEDEFANIMSSANGVVEMSENSYNAIAYELDTLSEEELKSRIDIINDKIVIKQSYTFDNVNPKLFGGAGEIVITHKFSREDIKKLQREYGWVIINIGKDTILAKSGSGGCELRWSKNETEIIVKTDYRYDFCKSFGLDESFRPKDGTILYIAPQNENILPQLPDFNNLSRIEAFERGKEYAIRLHKFLFDVTGSTSEDYLSILGNLLSYDINGWNKRYKNLQKVLYFISQLRNLPHIFRFGITNEEIYPRKNLYFWVGDNGSIVYNWGYEYSQLFGHKGAIDIDAVEGCAIRKLEETENHLNHLKEKC